MIAYKRLNGNMIKALVLFKSLRARFLLESASLQNKNRYSLIVKSINFSLFKNNGEYFYKDSENEINLSKSINFTLPILKDLESIDRKDFDFFLYLEYFRKKAPALPTELQSLSMLSLGGIGYLGYEFFSECEKVTFDKPALYDAPECYFVFPKESVIFDHFYDEMYLVCNSYSGLNINCEEILEILEMDVDNFNIEKSPEVEVDSKIIYEDGKEWFTSGVDDITKKIYEGVFLQAVLSRAINVKSNIPPLKFYEELRRKNPSPYMYYLDFVDFKIIGASPEVMLTCENNEAILKPIAGTRARGEDLREDLELEKELLNDEKENAEHLMLVDLARNDLGRCGLGGSVSVSTFKIIEKYSNVMHIVSEVRAKLDSKYSALDCLKCSFPAGTVSGAPKIMAIEVLKDLETHRRGIYAGCIGYIKANGDLDSALTIRTAIFKDGVYYLRAGAGIVLDSHKDKEFQETNNKLKSLLDILKINV